MIVLQCLIFTISIFWSAYWILHFKETELQDLAEALDLLPAPDLKALAKTFHLGGSGTQKQQLVEGLIKLSRQKSLFSLASPQNNIGAVILKR